MKRVESTKEVIEEPPAYKPFSLHDAASRPALPTMDTQAPLLTGPGSQLPLGGLPRDNMLSKPILDHQPPL